MHLSQVFFCFTDKQPALKEVLVIGGFGFDPKNFLFAVSFLLFLFYFL